MNERRERLVAVLRIRAPGCPRSRAARERAGRRGIASHAVGPLRSRERRVGFERGGAASADAGAAGFAAPRIERGRHHGEASSAATARVGNRIEPPSDRAGYLDETGAACGRSGNMESSSALGTANRFIDPRSTMRCAWVVRSCWRSAWWAPAAAARDGTMHSAGSVLDPRAWRRPSILGHAAHRGPSEHSHELEGWIALSSGAVGTAVCGRDVRSWLSCACGGALPPTPTSWRQFGLGSGLRVSGASEWLCYGARPRRRSVCFPAGMHATALFGFRVAPRSSTRRHGVAILLRCSPSSAGGGPGAGVRLSWCSIARPIALDFFRSYDARCRSAGSRSTI